MQFEIKIDAVPCIKYLDNIAKKQLPFAYSLAINNSAYKARDKFLQTWPSQIARRTSWWQIGNKWGFNVKNSTKQDLVASIYTRAPWIVSSEIGETRRPYKASTFAIPSSVVRRTKRELIAPSQKPRALKRKFFARLPSGRSGIFVRQGSGKGQFAKLMYTIVRTARIPAVLKFRETVSKEVNRVFPAEFNAAFERAMKSAK